MSHKLENSAPARQANLRKPGAHFFWPAVIAISLIAFFFRFYRLADHPLGTFFDPAINGLDAVRLIQRGGPVIFFPTNGGREAVFMYLLIPFINLFGTTPFSLRALTAAISLLNVVLLFAFLYRTPLFLSNSNKDNSRLSLENPASRAWFASLASLVLAVSYWHIAISRLGQRPILVPVLSVPLFWFFLQGWHTGRRSWFFLAGLLMGLEGHTYSAARLLPLILTLALLPEFFFLRSNWPYLKPRLINLGLFILAALLVYSPLAWYLLHHPAQFGARAFSVMIWSFLDTPDEIAAELGRNLLRVAGFFCCAGSPNPIFGLPGYPGSPLLLLPFLLLGLGTALQYWRNLFFRLVVLWWFIGLLPSIIAIEAPHPLRMIVAVVPTAILIALGLMVTLQWLQRKISRPPYRRLLYLLPVLLILLPIPALYRAYFRQWTDLQAARGAYDYGAVAIRNEVLAHTGPGVALYLPLARFNDSTLLYYLSGPYRRQARLSVPPAGTAMVLSPERNETDQVWVRLQDHTATILPPLTAPGQQLLQTALAGASDGDSIRTTDGEIVARLASLPRDPAQFLQQPAQSTSAVFGPLQLTGVAYEGEIEFSKQEHPVTLFWQATHPTSTEYEVLLRLVDDQRRVWATGDARPNDWAYPTSFWRPELDHIAARHLLRPLEASPLPPGRYWLAVSVFDPASQQRIPLTAGRSDSPDTFFLGPLKVPLPPDPAPTTTTTGVTFGASALLSGVAVNPLDVQAGQPIQVTLSWQALATPPVDYTVFVHLLDSEGNLVAGQDTQPRNGTYPTTIWSPGEQIIDPHTLPVPDTLAPGRYQLAIGLYHQPTGERLPATLPDGTTEPHNSFTAPQSITVQSAK